MSKSYSDLFKDPRWQKKRLKVFERDDWACQKCYNTESTLNVHHKYYKDKTEPWDYPLEALITLCENCHISEKEDRAGYEQSLLYALRQKFLAEDISEIATGFYIMQLCHLPEIVAAALSWALSDENIQKELIERYLKSVRYKSLTVMKDNEET